MDGSGSRLPVLPVGAVHSQRGRPDALLAPRAELPPQRLGNTVPCAAVLPVVTANCRVEARALFRLSRRLAGGHWESPRLRSAGHDLGAPTLMACFLRWLRGQAMPSP